MLFMHEHHITLCSEPPLFKMPPPGNFTLLLVLWLLGWALINWGLELEPLNGMEHPWLDTAACLLQTWGGALKNWAVRRLHGLLH